MTNAPLPFFPMLEPVELKGAIDGATERWFDVAELLWEVLWKYLVGFRERPPSARLEWYRMADTPEYVQMLVMNLASIKPDLAQVLATSPLVAVQPFAALVATFRSLGPEAAKEVAHMSRDYASLLREDLRKQRAALSAGIPVHSQSAMSNGTANVDGGSNGF